MHASMPGRGGAARIALALVAVMLAAAPAAAQEKVPPPSREAAQYSFAPIVKKAAPAVVNVYVRGCRARRHADEFRRFFGERFGMPQDDARARA